MKKFLKILLIFVLFLLSFANTKAKSINVDDDIFFIEEGVLIEYYGNAAVVEIPYDITSINSFAFFGHEEITDITIPDTVAEIGEYAFSDCINLKNVKLPKKLKSIGGSAFSSCTSLENISIPKGITILEKDMFFDCENLQSVTLPKGLEQIKESAFTNCINLTNINIPNTVEYIDIDVFWACENLTDITIPDSVEYIGQYAFYRCDNLTIHCIENSVAYDTAEMEQIPIELLDISVNNKNLTLKVKDTYKLYLKNVFSKYADITWKSNNKDIVKVNKNGKVTALKKGTAAITATYNDIKYKCKITVKID